MNNYMERMWSLTAAVLLAITMLALWVWPKFFGVEIHPIFAWAEMQSGIAWLEPNARWAVGSLALVIAVCLLIKPIRMQAAYAALILSLAFTAAHLTPWLGWNIPNYTPLMDAFAAGATASDVEAMGLKGDRGAHLSLALVNGALAFMVVMLERNLRKPKPTRRSVLAMADA